MVYIFHGDNQLESRSAFNNLLSTFSSSEIMRTDSKEINPDKIIQFIQGSSLFTSNKVLAVSNYFSIPKATLDKIEKVLKNNPECELVIWQDKKLTVAQTNSFPKAKVEAFQLNNKLFACLNAIKPKNLKNFIPIYHDYIGQDTYDLFLYMVKNNIKKQLTSYSRFDEKMLIRTYLQLIELDFQNKTGQLAIPKEMALERILINLVK
jgi:hypothetical protein